MIYKSTPASRGKRLAAIASSFIGAPYRYGGISPGGFDCSGLVYYTHKKAGINIPRSTSEQYRYMSPVRQPRLHPGDLVFFRISRQKVSHVGIYKGDNQFIHAPSSGKKVTISRLDNPYWQNRYVGSGRFYPY
jgi:cell wall-associated NlpC family hydrolase